MAWQTKAVIEEREGKAMSALKAGGRFESRFERGHLRYSLVDAQGVRVPGVGNATFKQFRARGVLACVRNVLDGAQDGVFSVYVMVTP